MQPDFYGLRKELLKVIEDYDKGILTLDEVHNAADDLNDEFFPKEYPELDKNDINNLYMQAMFLLESVTFNKSPENIQLAREALYCKGKELHKFIEKLDDLGELTKW